MGERLLRAVKALERPPLSNVPERLRLLANELPEGTTGCIVITDPDLEVYGYGDMDSLRKTLGVLYMAMQKISLEEAQQGVDDVG